jgi:hypothetical protein
LDRILRAPPRLHASVGRSCPLRPAASPAPRPRRTVGHVRVPRAMGTGLVIACRPAISPLAAAAASARRALPPHHLVPSTLCKRDANSKASSASSSSNPCHSCARSCFPSSPSFPSGPPPWRNEVMPRGVGSDAAATNPSRLGRRVPIPPSPDPAVHLLNRGGSDRPPREIPATAPHLGEAACCPDSAAVEFEPKTAGIFSNLDNT